MSAVDIRNETGWALDTEAMAAAVRATLDFYGGCERAQGHVTILLCDDCRVRALNRQFRGIDSVTDVLSFPALPHGIDEEQHILGELVVAVPWTARQAILAGHRLRDDLVLLAVHGTLHLLGHTHDSDERREAMWAAQDAVLQRLGVPSGNPGDLELASAIEDGL